MRGKQSNEFDVQFPASEVWKVYGTLTMTNIVKSLNLFRDIKVTGNGSVGTQFEIFLLPGAPFDSFKERITALDEKRRIKEVKVFEGGVINIGFISFTTRFEIIEKDCNLTTIKSSYIYEIKDESSANEAVITVNTWGIVVKAIVDYLSKNTSTSTTEK